MIFLGWNGFPNILFIVKDNCNNNVPSVQLNNKAIVHKGIKRGRNQGSTHRNKVFVGCEVGEQAQIKLPTGAMRAFAAIAVVAA